MISKFKIFPNKNIKAKDIFVDKLVSDVNNFSDSNTSAIEANRRMCNDSEVIYDFSKTYPLLKDELQALNQVKKWLKEGADRKISFTDIMNRRGLPHIAKELANNVKKSIKADKLKINTSIINLGCIFLIETMREYGVPIEYNFFDISGVVQAKKLASEENYSAALISFSTIYLSSERKQIIEKYKYLCPITYEEQMVLGKRNTINGEFLIKKTACPVRSTGHYQLITMMGNAELGINADNFIDLCTSKKDNADSIVLYQPMADAHIKTKCPSEHWGYVNNRSFPIDIMLVVNEKEFEGDIASFQSLAIVLMAMMKSDLKKAKTFANELYNKKEYRDAFEKATANKILLKENNN